MCSSDALVRPLMRKLAEANLSSGSFSPENVGLLAIQVSRNVLYDAVVESALSLSLYATS